MTAQGEKVPVPLGRPLEVLVVDDSAVVRQALLSMLGSQPDMRVTLAGDGLAALEKMERASFDVIILDLEMPRMDGLTFLQKIMPERPVPVVICSAIAGTRADIAMRALELGAVEIVAKPQYGIKQFLQESTAVLVAAVRAAAKARPRKASSSLSRSALPRSPERYGVPLPSNGETIVAIGASTGGTEAIGLILKRLPADAPGTVIAQHMPEGFTAAFARNLDSACALHVKQAEDGDPVLAGTVLVAPGNRHLTVHRNGSRHVVRISDSDRVSGHRPSVDVLFLSMAELSGTPRIGVLLTGMGSDGASGLLEMRRSGATTLVQDETSSVVFGMPKEAIARGAAEQIVPLADMAEAILRRARRCEPPAQSLG